MEEWGIPEERMPEMRILSSSELNAYGKYDAVENVVYYIPEILNDEISQGVAYIEYHEMWHMKQAENYRNKGNVITKETRGEYIKDTCRAAKRHIDRLEINEYNIGELGDYATLMFLQDRYDEVEAEYMAQKRKGRLL